MAPLESPTEDFDSEYTLLRNNFHFRSRRNLPYRCGFIAFALLVIGGSTLFALYLLDLLPITNTDGCPRGRDNTVCSANGYCTSPGGSPKICECKDGFTGSDCGLPATNIQVFDLHFDLIPNTAGLNWTIPINGDVSGTYNFQTLTQAMKMNFDFSCGSYQCYESNCGQGVPSASNPKKLIIRDSAFKSCIYSVQCVATGVNCEGAISLSFVSV